MEPQLNESQGGGYLDETVNFRQYLHIILERRWLVLTSFLSVIILTVIYLMTATPIYFAKTRLHRSVDFFLDLTKCLKRQAVVGRLAGGGAAAGPGGGCC